MQRARSRALHDIPQRVVAGLGDTKISIELASQRLRQNTIRVGGIQRKVDTVVASLMSIIRVLLISAAVILAYDQLHDHKLLPSWAHIDILDRLATRIQPYPVAATLAFIILGLYLIRQAGHIGRRYSEPIVPLPDNRLPE
jgi:hypothetical protein